MSRVRANSSPDLLPSSCNLDQAADDSTLDGANGSTLEGVATNVKLLLKLLQDHNEACSKDSDNRKTQRMAGMISIIDEVKNRIQKLQSIGQKREAELRRCYTDLKSNPVPREKKTPEALTDENEKLQKELNASVAARKSLERMFSSLGKEKEIMATELSRKVQELTGIEEHLNDLKAQNELLLGKVQTCAAEHKGNIHSNRGDAQGNTTLQERNKTLSEQLLKSLDRYRSLKRKLKEAQQEKADIQAKIGILTGETQQEKTRIPLNDPKRSEFTKSTPDLKAGKAFVLA